MKTYRLEKTFDEPVAQTEKVAAVAEIFGIVPDSIGHHTLVEELQVELGCGQVCLICGSSGAGKSTILELLKEQLCDLIDPDAIVLPTGRSLVDCFDLPLGQTLQYLSLAGLSDATALLKTPWQLSDGQRYRLRLALALSQQPAVVCIDECCATLDRVTAAVVAHNIRKCADCYGTTFILATSHDDLLEDLDPDVVILKHLGVDAEVYYPREI